MNTEIRRNTPVLYFISDTQGHCKIGIASDIQSRFSTLQVSSAFELRIIHLEYRSTISEVQELERKYHSALIEHRVRGEWYKEQSVVKHINGDKISKKSYLFENDPKFNMCDLVNLFCLLLESNNESDFRLKYHSAIPEYMKRCLENK